MGMFREDSYRADRRTVLRTTAGLTGVSVFGSAAAIADSGGPRPRLNKVGHSLLEHAPGRYSNIHVREDLGLAALGHLDEGDTGRGTYIADVSDPAEPTHAGHVGSDPATRVNDVWFHPTEPYVFSSNEGAPEGNGGFQVVDVSDPTDPQELLQYDLELGPGRDGVHTLTVLDEDHLLLSGTGRGLVVMDVSDVENPVEIAAFQVEDHFLHDTQVRGNLAFLAHWNAGTWILDMSDPANPVPLATFDYRPRDGDLYRDNHHVVPHPTEDIMLLGEEIGLGDPGKKRIVSFDTDYGPIDPDEEDLDGGTEELSIFTHPQGNAQMPESQQAFWWTGHFGEWAPAGQKHLHISGDFAAGVQLYDISDPTDPERVSQHLPSSGVGEAASEDTIFKDRSMPAYTWAAKVGESGLSYVSDSQTGLYVFDLENV